MEHTRVSWCHGMLVKFDSGVFMMLLREMKHRFTNVIPKLKDNLQFWCSKMKNHERMLSSKGASAKKWWSYFFSKVAVLPQYL